MYCHTSSSVQLEIGNTRKCSPGCSRVLNSVHSSGRWALGCHWPKLSRCEKMRSLARAFSSSRRAPPISASKRNSSMASSSVTDWCTLRDSPGWRQAHGAALHRVLDAAHDQLGAQFLARGSRGSRSPPGSCGRCRSSAAGRGCGPTPKAFSAHLSSTSESLPPENSRVGRSKAAATSRRMKMASSSSASRWRLLSWPQQLRFGAGVHADDLFLGLVFFHVQAAFLGGLVFPPPAAGAEVLAQADGAGAGRAADAGVELVVQRVVVDAVAARCSARRRPRSSWPAG